MSLNYYLLSRIQSSNTLFMSLKQPYSNLDLALLTGPYPRLVQGWDNPFNPSGSVSADADRVVRLWKERRLDKWCGEEGGIIPSIPLVV